jgi:hypothetical protein
MAKALSKAWYGRFQLPYRLPSTPINRLVYIVAGNRVVGYDNERGKGDHKHLGSLEVAYVFRNVPTLLADFKSDLKGVTE